MGAGHRRPFTAQLLGSDSPVRRSEEDGGNITEHRLLLEQLFPWALDVEWFRERLHYLCWVQHGGSGYSFTRKCILGMTVDEIEWHVERAARQRKDMSAAIKREMNKK